MKLTIQHQESYSRGELLLRTFFGWIYIIIPHAFILLFVSLWGAILQFVAFWVILFTGRYPQSMFEFQVGLMKWNLRVSARLYNISDGYPAFGLERPCDFSPDLPFVRGQIDDAIGDDHVHAGVSHWKMLNFA